MATQANSVTQLPPPLGAIPFSAVEEDLRNLSKMDKFRMLPVEERKRRIDRLSPQERMLLPYHWAMWARPSQLPPPEPWVNWLLQAGRGYGKTRVGAEMIRKWKDDNPITHIIAATNGDITKVILEGPAGLLKICPPHEMPIYKGQKSTLEWPNGAKTLVFSAEEPERLRGPQCYKLWADEIAAWKRAKATWDNAVFGLRLGNNPQAVITTTPRNIPLLKEIIKDKGTKVTRGTTYENKHNLAKRFLSEVITKYEGTRIGRQELNGELLEDNPGALWTLGMIDADRVDTDLFWASVYPALARIVVGVDPAVTSNEDSDETGIVTVGKDRQSPPHLYVFDDRSCVDRPQGWATRAISAYKQFKADRIVGETNNGGEMVESTIHNVNPNAAFTAVHASRGKITRAEPISALYEQHRVHHVGALPQLEDQMCDYDPATASYSPDRMDAAVWAATELIGGGNGVLEYWDQQMQAKKREQANVPMHVDTQMQTPEQKADMGLYKISTPSNLAKPATSQLTGAQTQACPNCGNVALARFIEGAWSCGNCGCKGRDAEPAKLRKQ